MQVEKDKRLSESILWRLQDKAFMEFGPDAWISKGVPSYLTSSPFTAHAFVNLVIGYLRRKLDPNEPLYLFDLGAGSGRFSYLFIKELKERLARLSHLHQNVCLVMTDITVENLKFWEEHPKLAPLLEEGWIDLALFWHDSPLPIRLWKKGIALKETVNPVVLIGNYFFDTLPQELYQVRDGELFEGLVTVESGSGRELDDPEGIADLKVSFSYPEKVTETELTKEYLKYDDLTFLLPVGGFQALETFERLSGGRLLLIACDQGAVSPSQMEEPQMAKHGCFSFPVNYHAIGRWFERRGGTPLISSFSNPAFVHFTALLGQGDDAEVKEAFHSYFDPFEPQDYWRLEIKAEEETKGMSLEYLWLLLKLGHWDPLTFNALIPKILPKIGGASPEMKEKFKEATQRTWEVFFPVTKEEGNFVLNLGVILFQMEEFEKAALFFQRALEMLGESEIARQNLEVCNRKLIT